MNGGPTLDEKLRRKFLDRWGIRHRLSSAYYPASNSRAELGVKASKRMIKDNTGPGRNVNNDEVSRALLQYLNTPLRGVPELPAKIVFGRSIKDSLPSKPMRKSWVNQDHHKELGMAKIRVATKERMDEKSKNLVPLKVGNYVKIQNQVGPKPTRWDKSGRVVETHGHRQYSV